MNENHIPNLSWPSTLVTPQDRHLRMGHKSCVLWLTGLSGSGKSTIAYKVEKKLFDREWNCFVLDGDHVRRGLNHGLGFDKQDRQENIRRLAETAKLFTEAGMIVIISAISPYQDDRHKARDLCGQEQFIEIYVKCPLEECEKRDPKGLYLKARSGEIQQFTGISAPYEPPIEPEIIVESFLQSPDESADLIVDYLHCKLSLSNDGDRSNEKGP